VQRPVPYLVAVAVLSACSNPGKSSLAPLESVPLPVQSPTDLAITPRVWETIGGEARPALSLVDGAAIRELAVSFRYQGPGDVQVPGRGWVPADSSEILYEGSFVASPSSQDGQGVVVVTVTDPTDGETVSEAKWPILLRERIIAGIDHLRAPVMLEEDYFACYVAVRYTSLPAGLSAPAERDAQVELVATIEKQGGFDPVVTVTGDIDPEVHQRPPQGFEENEAQRVFYVSVRRPAYPPMRRAYLNLEARIGGDSQSTFVPLPNR